MFLESICYLFEFVVLVQFFDVQACEGCKSQLDIGQSSNLHSQSCSTMIEPDFSPENDGTDVLDSGHLTHETRISNLTDYEQELKTRIKFPPSHDPVWKEIDKEL